MVMFFDDSMSFKATMYKRGGIFIQKKLKLRVVKHIGKKIKKDGKCSIQINAQANSGSGIIHQDFKLKASVDKRAFISMSINVQK